MEQGAWGIVRAARSAAGEFPGIEYLDSLSDTDRAKLDRWIEQLAEHGKISNPEKFKQIENTDPTLFTFKSKPHRLLGFFRGKGVFLITNGYEKRNQKINRKDKQNVIRAQTIRSATERYLTEGSQ